MSEIELDKSQNTYTDEDLEKLTEILHLHKSFIASNGKNGFFFEPFDDSKNTYTKEQLGAILEQHQLWLDTDGKQGARANLAKARLINVNLKGKNLSEATLNGAILRLSDISGADLSKAHLHNADLTFTKLQATNFTETHLNEALLIHANCTRATFQEAKLSDANLYYANFHKANLSKAKLSRANCKNTDFLDTNLYDIDFEGANFSGARFLNDTLQNLFLNQNIQAAQDTLANSLISADKRIIEYRLTARYIGFGAFFLIIVDLAVIFYIWYQKEVIIALLTKTGMWGLTLYSFPILIIFSIAITLLRHQKKLLDEVRYYSADKRHIELYSGLLRASQYAAASLNDPKKSAKYVQETFTAIRDRILSEQPHTNTAGSAVEKEEYGYSLLQSIADTQGKVMDVYLKSETKK